MDCGAYCLFKTYAFSGFCSLPSPGDCGEMSEPAPASMTITWKTENKSHFCSTLPFSASGTVIPSSSNM